jgi:hypothetical protein
MEINNFSNGGSTSTYTKVNITTNSLALFDESGTMLKLGFLNENVTIMMCSPVISNEGKKTYPQEARVNFLINADRVGALHDVIMDKVLSAIAENRNYNGGVFLDQKKNRVFDIRVQDGDVYAVYYIDIDADRRPKRTVVFKFNKAPIIEKYSPESGEFELREAHSQFFVFVKALSGFLECISGINAHAYKYTNMYQNNRISKMLEEVCVKLGINITPNRTMPFNGNSLGSDDSSMPVIGESTDLANLLL